jgi:hypothetical protein
MFCFNTCDAPIGRCVICCRPWGRAVNSPAVRTSSLTDYRQRRLKASGWLQPKLREWNKIDQVALVDVAHFLGHLDQAVGLP